MAAASTATVQRAWVAVNHAAGLANRRTEAGSERKKPCLLSMKARAGLRARVGTRGLSNPLPCHWAFHWAIHSAVHGTVHGVLPNNPPMRSSPCRPGADRYIPNHPYEVLCFCSTYY